MQLLLKECNFAIHPSFELHPQVKSDLILYWLQTKADRFLSSFTSCWTNDLNHFLPYVQWSKQARLAPGFQSSARFPKQPRGFPAHANSIHRGIPATLSPIPAVFPQ